MWWPLCKLHVASTLPVTCTCRKLYILLPVFGYDKPTQANKLLHKGTVVDTHSFSHYHPLFDVTHACMSDIKNKFIHHNGETRILLLQMLAFKKAPQIWPSLPPASPPLNVNDWEINERRFIGHSFNGSNYSRLTDYSGSMPCFPNLLFWPWDEVNILLKLSVKKATVMGRIMVRSLWWWQKETCGGISACGLDLVRLELHDGLLYLLEWCRETPWGQDTHKGKTLKKM